MRLPERFYHWRNRLLTDAGFRKWAASFPLTRPIARAKAREVFDLCAGFVYSQVLYACVALDILRIVRDAPLDVETLAARIAMPADGTDRLARAAASLKLLRRRADGRYGLGERGAALLGAPSVLDMISHHAVLYADLQDPAALLRRRSSETQLAEFWRYARGEGAKALQTGDVAAYSDLMASTQAFVAEEILDAYSFRDCRRLLDVGGGAGAFVRAAGAAAPHLHLMVFDLPAVARIAEARLAEAGFGARASCFGGDFLRDPLPEGADAMTLIRVLHDHDDDAVDVIFRAARKALPQGRPLLIAEPMAETPGAEAMGEAYFGLYLWAMGAGRPRSSLELKAFLQRAGFPKVKNVATRQPLLTSLIVAT